MVMLTHKEKAQIRLGALMGAGIMLLPRRWRRMWVAYVAVLYVYAMYRAIEEGELT